MIREGDPGTVSLETSRRLRALMLALLVAFAVLVIVGAPSPAAAPNMAVQLYAFGNNHYGQLGSATNNGTDKANPTPTLVTLPGASGPVTQVAAALYHSLAVTSTGQLYAFGLNYVGQLGSATNNGTPKPNPTPVLVSLPGATGSVTEVAAAAYHSLAVTSTGQLYAFGNNGLGQLGSAINNGTNNANPTPVLVSLPGASGPVTQIAAGGSHSLVLTSTGQLYAFGINTSGQLGSATNNGTLSANPTPTLVSLPGANGPVTQIAAGGSHSLVLTSTGQLYAFGWNHVGQLGSAINNGTNIANPTPTLVTLPGASGPVTQIAAGGSHSLVLTSTGQLYAFGLNLNGQLGIATNSGTATPNPTPTLVTLPGANGPVTQIAAGGLYSLAVTSTGQLYAFGHNWFGELGSAINNGTNKPNPTPTLVRLPAGITIDAVARGSSAFQTLVIAAGPLGTAPPTVAQLMASLDSQLTAKGKTAKIAALLKTKGYAMSFTALGAGVVVIDWYYLPSSKTKPVLVAAGKRTFEAAGTLPITVKLTAKGKQLLKKARRIRLTAKGTFTAPGKPAVSATTSFTLTR